MFASFWKIKHNVSDLQNDQGSQITHTERGTYITLKILATHSKRLMDDAEQYRNPGPIIESWSVLCPARDSYSTVYRKIVYVIDPAVARRRSTLHGIFVFKLWFLSLQSGALTTFPQMRALLVESKILFLYKYLLNISSANRRLLKDIFKGLFRHKFDMQKHHSPRSRCKYLEVSERASERACRYTKATRTVLYTGKPSTFV
jgi:hypothetical protein